MATPQDIRFFNSPEFQELLKRYEQAASEKEIPYFELDDLSDILSYYLYRMRFKDAERAVAIAERLFHGSTEYIKMAARFMLCTGRPKQAIEYLSQFEHFSDNEIKRLQAEAFLFLKDFENAKKIALDILKDSENDPENIHDALSIIIECGYVNEALVFCENLLRSNPAEKALLEIKAECFTDLQKCDEAISIYNSLLDEEPYNTIYWERLGHLYFSIGRYAKSLECYEYHNTIEEDFDYVKLMQGYCYFRLRNYKSAKELFAWCGNNSPELSMQSMFYTALAHYYEGDNKSAIDTFDKFIGIANEGSIEITLARINKAIILDDIGESSRAEEAISLALLMMPVNLEQLLLTDKRLYEPRDSENVTNADLDIFEKKEWTLKEELFALGTHLIRHANLLPAKKVFEYLLQNGDANPDTHACLAYIIFKTNKTEDIQRHLEHAIYEKSDLLYELFNVEFSSNMTTNEFLSRIQK